MAEETENKAVDETPEGENDTQVVTSDEPVEASIDALAEETAEEASTVTDAGASRRGFLSGLIPKLAIIVAIIASLIAGSLWWQYRQFYVELASDDAFLLESLEDARANQRRLEDELVELREALSARDSEVESISDDVEALPVELRALGRRVEALQGGQLDARDNWLREQAEYYLVLANVELGLGGRVDSSITALELADDVLRDLGDPGLVDVRSAIAEELQNLRAVEVPDLEGHAAALGGLIERLPDLPMRAASPQNFGAPEEPLDDVEPGLGRLLERTRGAVTSIVRVERQEEPVGRLLTESERRVVRQQLALELQLARTAVLERRQETLRSSLVAADAILNQDFDRTAQSIIETRRLLGELATVELSPPLPDIGDSLSLLRNAPGAN